MLQAHDTLNNVVSLFSLDQETIVRHKRKGLFYCPVCKERVVIKSGGKMVPHFAHLPRSACSEKGGGEGEYHERGKLKLYEWIKAQGIHTKLEPFLPSIQQRPDLLLSIQNKRIAIEYQCARIPAETFKKRNIGYKKCNIHPIWILGGNRMNRLDGNTLSLHENDRLFIHQFTSGFPLTMYFYCPNSNKLSFFQDIICTGKKKSFGIISFQHLHHLSFLDLFQKKTWNQTQLLAHWQWEKYTQRTRYSPYPSKMERKWRGILYQKNLHPVLLPSITHLPTRGQLQAKVPPWLWQSKLVVELIEVLPVGAIFTRNNCYALLKQLFYPPSRFPLIQQIPNAIDSYLHLLTKLEYIKPTSSFHFQKIKQIDYPKQVEKAIQDDNALMEQLLVQNDANVYVTF
ncbi:competence protein CoiA [Aquibacillus sp. 3ASR75-11]|uniref:Competence protein CoiA n=1 Tax=Terrihalobacillus insolitus TaxID=2950438 RepID=A0A9X3WVP4_9BACI|nr:competence protein CoiA family protein [Terrihalobacillus insolitus]MDC3425433.1 competence protein CoiA [Terrihalobacillus insolitus]